MSNKSYEQYEKELQALEAKREELKAKRDEAWQNREQHLKNEIWKIVSRTYNLKSKSDVARFEKALKRSEPFILKNMSEDISNPDQEQRSDYTPF